MVPSGIANCAGNGRTIPDSSEGDSRNTFTQLTHVNTLQLVHVRGWKGRVWNAGSSIQRLSRNVILITLTSFHGCRAFMPPVYSASRDSSLLSIARTKKACNLHWSLFHRPSYTRYNRITKPFKRGRVSMRSIFVR